MQYFYRCYLWEHGLKTTEYTDKMVAPFFYSDHLDHTLDTANLVLDCMPISSKTAFQPKTRFRIERYLNENDSVPVNHFDMLVQCDNVQEYVGDNSLCTHRILLQEASIEAQGKHVDNIALTYELRDVNLEYKTTVSSTEKALAFTQNGGYDRPVHINEGYYGVWDDNDHDFRFKNSYKYMWLETDDSLHRIIANQSATTANNITFTIPTLEVYGSYDNQTWTDLFEMNVKTTVTRYQTIYGARQPNTAKIELTRYTGVATNIDHENDGVWCALSGTGYFLTEIREGSADHPNNSGAVDNFDKHYSIGDFLTNRSKSSKTVNILTPILSDGELADGIGYEYVIDIIASPASAQGMISYYEAKQVCTWQGWWIFSTCKFVWSEVSKQTVTPTSVYNKVSFKILDLTKPVTYLPTLIRPNRYSCYELIRKALLTCETHSLDSGIDKIEYWLQIKDSNLIDILNNTYIYETIFEEKNLWEVLTQVGYYIHAIPHLEFSEDGSDRFILNFTKLGQSKVKEDTSSKITIFNAQDLSQYFTAFDSYVMNLYSPQNIKEEWISCKTADSSFLISNNTAQIQLEGDNLEILEFDICYNGVWKSALNYIFDKSIYAVFTSNDRLKPSKAFCLYSEIGSNLIQGLQYTPPSKNNDKFMALKNIVQFLFGGSQAELRFNDLSFHVKYHSQDSARLYQERPNLSDFIKFNLESFPHHEQFYGQQDVIPDSERYSLNLYGQLIGMSNNVYERQEYAEYGDEKIAGELVVVNGDNYYVTSVQSEYHADMVLQKVTYSKDFNELAKICTIPSAPRVNQIASKTTVRREILMHEFFTISTVDEENPVAAKYYLNGDWQIFLSNLVFFNNKPEIPNYAYTKFMGDVERIHTGENVEVIPQEHLFPKSGYVISDNGNVLPEESASYSDSIVSLKFFPEYSGMHFEWDMYDNFKVGDCVETRDSGTTADDTVDSAYYGQQPVRYCDVMGRADLMQFKLFFKNNWSAAQINALPRTYTYKNVNGKETTQSFVPVKHLISPPANIAIDKDNREALSFNLRNSFQWNRKNIILFNNIWGLKVARLKVALCKDIKNEFNVSDLLSTAIYDGNAQVLNVAWVIKSATNKLSILFADSDKIKYKGRFKSIVFYDDAAMGKPYYIVVNSSALEDLFIYPSKFS